MSKIWTERNKQLFAYLALVFVSIAAVAAYDAQQRSQDKKEVTKEIITRVEPRIDRLEKTIRITGAKGASGQDGINGKNGTTGADGKQGLPGLRGLLGEQGPRGLPGAQGPRGLPGAQGPKGEKGDRGVPGAQGLIGPHGPIGPPGPAGTNGSVDVNLIVARVKAQICAQIPDC